MQIFESNSPVIDSGLLVIRDRQEGIVNFRKAVNSMSISLSGEATKSISDSSDVIAIPILRAGLGLLAGFLEAAPAAEVGFLGMKRDEETLLPETYMERIPDDLSAKKVFVLEPMLATGGSLSDALKLIFSRGAKSVTLISLLVAPEGIARLEKDFPGKNIDLYCAKIDEGLDAVGYIVPGIGDAGDRLFGIS
jgi:uracil phosphoribosyltransferase